MLKFLRYSHRFPKPLTPTFAIPPQYSTHPRKMADKSLWTAGDNIANKEADVISVASTDPQDPESLRHTIKSNEDTIAALQAQNQDMKQTLSQARLKNKSEGFMKYRQVSRLNISSLSSLSKAPARLRRWRYTPHQPSASVRINANPLMHCRHGSTSQRKNATRA